MKRSIHLKTFLPYPTEVVWEALTDPKLLGQWLMQNDIEPKPHHQFTFRMAPQKGWDGRMEHSGYKGFKLVLISYIMEMGWKKQLKKKLPALLSSLNAPPLLSSRA